MRLQPTRHQQSVAIRTLEIGETSSHKGLLALPLTPRPFIVPLKGKMRLCPIPVQELALGSAGANESLPAWLLALCSFCNSDRNSKAYRAVLSAAEMSAGLPCEPPQRWECRMRNRRGEQLWNNFIHVWKLFASPAGNRMSVMESCVAQYPYFVAVRIFFARSKISYTRSSETSYPKCFGRR